MKKKEEMLSSLKEIMEEEERINKVKRIKAREEEERERKRELQMEVTEKMERERRRKNLIVMGVPEEGNHGVQF